MSYQLVFVEPGHFHAALVLRDVCPRVDSRIHVYGPSGPELAAFTALVDSFNSRDENPTAWIIEHHETDSEAGVPEALLRDHHAAIAVLAGKNNVKLERISTLAKAGIHVLADKPWLTDPNQAGLLDGALSADAAVMDIMTIRYEILSRLCHTVVRTPSVFGEFDSTRGPAITLGSIHHLYKLVNAKPLRRPPWYFNASVQGDGMVDIQSHLVEQAMWFVLDEEGCSSEDIELVEARRTSTVVDADLFKDSTGLDEWPNALEPWLDSSNALQYPCNGEIRWKLKGVEIHQHATWREREPEGGGDLHSVVLHGTLADVVVEQGPDTDFKAQVKVIARGSSDVADLRARTNDAMEQWGYRFPGLTLVEVSGGVEFDAPSALDAGHESHFPLVRERYLDFLEKGGMPERITSRIAARYRLLAEASVRASEQAS